MKSLVSHFSCRPHPHLYEINTMVWLNELSRNAQGRIRLTDVPDQEWDVLQEKGFDYIWLMGIWERSPYSQSIAQSDSLLTKAYDLALPDWKLSDVQGSPYAVRAYRPDPELATWEQLDSVLEKLHQRDMKLILDFVPNHTAVDHDWVHSHPEYYVQGNTTSLEQATDGFLQSDIGRKARYLAHGKDPYFPAWTDTAQLNYFQEATRTAMVEELKNIAQHCDGVRCDMAMLVLNDVFQNTWHDRLGTLKHPEKEFWTEAITAVPDFVWIAEVYWDLEWTLQQLGFVFTYDKRLYDRLCHASPWEVFLHLNADVSYQNHLVRFLENHDEPRSASIFDHTHFPAVAALTATLPGMRMYHQGQLEGKRIRLPIQLRRTQVETLDHERREVYDRLLHITNEDIFHDGQWRLLSIQSAGDSTFKNLIGYLWQSHSTYKIVVVNLASVESYGFLQIFDKAEIEDTDFSLYKYADQLTGQEYTAHFSDLVEQGLYVRLNPFGAHIFSTTTPYVHNVRK